MRESAQGDVDGGASRRHVDARLVEGRLAHHLRVVAEAVAFHRHADQVGVELAVVVLVVGEQYGIGAGRQVLEHEAGAVTAGRRLLGLHGPGLAVPGGRAVNQGSTQGAGLHADVVHGHGQVGGVGTAGQGQGSQGGAEQGGADHGGGSGSG